MNPLDAELNVIRSNYIEKLNNQNLLIYVDMLLCSMKIQSIKSCLGGESYWLRYKLTSSNKYQIKFRAQKLSNSAFGEQTLRELVGYGLWNMNTLSAKLSKAR